MNIAILCLPFEQTGERIALIDSLIDSFELYLICWKVMTTRVQYESNDKTIDFIKQCICNLRYNWEKVRQFRDKARIDAKANTSID